jgi:hypothetical protein
VLLSERCAPGAIAHRLETAAGRPFVALVDYPTLPVLGTAFRHVAVLDPPAGEDDEAALAALPDGVDVHLVYGENERRWSLRAFEDRAPRAVCAATWRALATGALERTELVRVLARPPAEVARAVDVLAAAGLVTVAGGVVARLEAEAAVRLDDVADYARWLADHARRLRSLGGEATAAPAPVVAG